MKNAVLTLTVLILIAGAIYFTGRKYPATNECIAYFSMRIDPGREEASADYQKQLVELEKKNIDMKKRLDEYKVEGNDSWQKFKIEFSHDMDELGKAFKNLTVTNVK